MCEIKGASPHRDPLAQGTSSSQSGTRNDFRIAECHILGDSEVAPFTLLPSSFSEETEVQSDDLPGLPTTDRAEPRLVFLATGLVSLPLPVPDASEAVWTW